MAPSGFYAVKVGRDGPAVYTTWSACESAVKGFKGAQHKKFATMVEAAAYLDMTETATLTPPPVVQKMASPDTIVVYADGSALSNGRMGARAGAGVFFGEGDVRNKSEPVPSHEPQTNQRAELLAAILALRHAGDAHKTLEIRTDSKYVINGVTDWMIRWKLSGFQTAKGCPVLHQDMWCEIDSLIQKRQPSAVIWRHVKGHSNEPGNDAADRLAKSAAQQNS